MNPISLFITATLAALAVTGCDRPGTKTSAAPGSTTTSATTTAPATSTTTTPTSDTTSPNAPASSATTASSTAATGPASANAVTDTVLTGKVKAAIASDSSLKDNDISVKTENGVVTLSGTVKSQDQVTLATALAQRQEGVSRVESQVTVR